jgi:predicted nuclease of predicted toxin-antitoxin system
VRLELDENLGATWINGLRDRGHDVDTVSDEGMGGAFDADVLVAAAGASRALVTLDLDFSNPFRFPPGAMAGIVVLRVSDRPGRVELDAVLAPLCAALEVSDPTSLLWVVDARRVRQFEPPT